MKSCHTVLSEQEFVIDYERALMRLPDHQLWIWLMYRKGYTQEYIGMKLGVTQSDIAYHIGKTMVYLRALLNDEKEWS
ncbi:MAG: hypothetical protein P8Y09_12680 [Deltaproteobacteria bacterium]